MFESEREGGGKRIRCLAMNVRSKRRDNVKSENKKEEVIEEKREGEQVERDVPVKCVAVSYAVEREREME